MVGNIPLEAVGGWHGSGGRRPEAREGREAHIRFQVFDEKTNLDKQRRGNGERKHSLRRRRGIMNGEMKGTNEQIAERKNENKEWNYLPMN